MKSLKTKINEGGFFDNVGVNDADYFEENLEQLVRLIKKISESGHPMNSQDEKKLTEYFKFILNDKSGNGFSLYYSYKYPGIFGKDDISVTIYPHANEIVYDKFNCFIKSKNGDVSDIIHAIKLDIKKEIESDSVGGISNTMDVYIMSSVDNKMRKIKIK